MPPRSTQAKISSSLPIHSVRVLAAYHSSPTQSIMRASSSTEAGGAADGEAADDPSASEPLLQPTFVHSLLTQLDTLFSALGFDHQLCRRDGDAGGASTPMNDLAASISDEQRKILYGAFLCYHGILPSHQITASGAADAELLPFIMASLTQRAGEPDAIGDPKGLHATALRIAALGASANPWSPP